MTRFDRFTNRRSDRGIGTGTGTEPIAIDTLFRAMEHPIRRALIDAVVTAPQQQVELAVVVDQLDDQWGINRSGATSNLATTLTHVHLPHLVEAGIIEFDSENATIRYRGDERVESLLRWIRQELRPYRN